MNKRRRYKAKARRAEYRLNAFDRRVLVATYPFWKNMTPEQTVTISQKIMDEAFEALRKDMETCR